ncbi:Hin recombinase (plasmid) [Paracoccus liaowanqingii]|uniref:Hin recombinase n=1 Tax=Paracoccus liaowanqingii TaxID=2560053 RepID=A0A4Y5SR94_9RHOB|nr:helix-turn-helix domain-containing protein [Paracoccus liaowanqingii]QDA36022.1 Hin recombinase [Paracoccus liaowanqingii]
MNGDVAGNAIVIFYTVIMVGRTKKITPGDEKKIVASVRSGVPVAVLAKTYGVTRPTIYRAIRSFHDKAQEVHLETAAVSFTVDRSTLLAFDAFTERLGLKSRADALRRVCRVPAGFLSPDPDLADALRDVALELSAIGRNVNQLVATKNYEVRRGARLKLTRPQQQLLSDLLVHIDGVSAQVRQLEAKRASETFQRFVDGMSGVVDGPE